MPLFTLIAYKVNNAQTVRAGETVKQHGYATGPVNNVFVIANVNYQALATGSAPKACSMRQKIAWAGHPRQVCIR